MKVGTLEPEPGQSKEMTNLPETLALFTVLCSALDLLTLEGLQGM